MDQARSPRAKGLAPLIDKFEFLNAMSVPASPPSLSASPPSVGAHRFTRSRWRDFCPAIQHRPRALPYPDALSQYQHGQRFLHKTIPPEHPQTPPNPLVASVITTPTRMMGPRLPPDILTVSERRKLFEGPKYERPRTSGGEEMSQSKMTMVSSFKTGPASQLGPPVPIHAQPPRRRALTPPNMTRYSLNNPHDSSLSRPTWFLRPQPSSFQATQKGSPTKERPRVANLRENFELCPSEMVAVEYTLESSPRKAASISTLDAIPAMPVRGRYDAVREWGDIWPASYGGDMYTLAHRSRESSPDKSWAAPRHVAVPEWPEREHHQTGSNAFSPVASFSGKPRTPETPKFLEVPHFQSTPGRASMPPSSSPPRQHARATPPSTRYRSYGLSADAFSRSQSDSSTVRSNVSTLKRLFDSPTKPDADLLDCDPRNHNIANVLQGCSPSHQNDAATPRRAAATESTSLRLEAPRASPVRTPVRSPTMSPSTAHTHFLPGNHQKTTTAQIESPLKAKIGQFEALAELSDAFGDRGAAEAMHKLKSIQSVRKSRALRAWKRFSHPWARTKEEIPTKATAKAEPVVFGTSVLPKTAQVAGSRPLLKAEISKGINPGKAQRPASTERMAKSASETSAGLGSGVDSGTWWPSQHLHEPQPDEGKVLPPQRSLAGLDGNKDKASSVLETAPKVGIGRTDNRASYPRPSIGIAPYNTKSIRYGTAARSIRVRRQASKRGDPVVAKAQCRLEHPKPVRVPNVNMLASLCRSQTIMRSINSGQNSS